MTGVCTPDLQLRIMVYKRQRKKIVGINTWDKQAKWRAITVGADLIAQGRRVQIRLAMPQSQRAEFLRRLRTVSQGLPIAAQLEWSVSDQPATHPDNIITPIPLLPPIPTPNSFP